MPHEVDDVLTTLTLVDHGGSRSVPSVVVPRTIGEGPQELTIEVGVQVITIDRGSARVLVDALRQTLDERSR